MATSTTPSPRPLPKLHHVGDGNDYFRDLGPFTRQSPMGQVEGKVAIVTGGARGIGESAMSSGAAAVANAVAHATGQRFRTLPMTPRRVWGQLNDPPAAGESAKEE